jgi:hypothetical protein
VKQEEHWQGVVETTKMAEHMRREQREKLLAQEDHKRRSQGHAERHVREKSKEGGHTAQGHAERHVRENSVMNKIQQRRRRTQGQPHAERHVNYC